MNELDYEVSNIKYSSLHVPYALGIFLYRGGAKLNRRTSYRLMQEGNLGEPIMERLSIVKALHDYLEGKITGGMPRDTLRTVFNGVRSFFNYIDSKELKVSMEDLADVFISWGRYLSDKHLANKSKVPNPKHIVSSAGGAIAYVCGITSNSLVRSCRLPNSQGFKSPSKSKFISSVDSYCDDLLSVVSCLSVKAITGKLPVFISVESSDLLYCSYARAGLRNLVVNKEQQKDFELYAQNGNGSIASHINLRLICELMLFIKHTAANFEQATRLTYSNKKMTYAESGVKYHAYKNRKGGEVSYLITSAYSEVFKNYLDFRGFVVKLYPSDALFPFIRRGQFDSFKKVQDIRVRQLMSKLGRTYIPPSVLRVHALNKLLQVTSNIDDAITLGQHQAKTFFRSYYQPNHNVAAQDWSRFWAMIEGKRKAALVFGKCEGNKGVVINSVTEGAPKPDCINPAGCLFCMHYRGVKTFDYIWALLSYRQLKLLEYSKSKASVLTDSITPLEGVVARIAEIEKQFCGGGRISVDFHCEAKSRISESHYHPYWSGFIELLEQP
ncbi:hypothetical protein [Pseudomonas oryzihabitans]|uniref:hypothetical protein n=1 Tax=Pseudomonas oryzihabitans TaxID=47885 RepID=UPI002863F731|nr:hypothetical protein [Pseudomonas psychrotolerans]MDR6679507.1 hypothetical protein [Pseudomonas psychrotolerans]